MSEFVVETYVPRESTSMLAARVEELALAAEQISAAGAEVRVLGALFLPADETCFYLYQAASADTVRAAAARGRVDLTRITKAVSIRTSQTGVAAGSQQPYQYPRSERTR
jgi:hypothetical protein